MQLVIAEKPSVGVVLAKALGVTEKKDGYIASAYPKRIPQLRRTVIMDM